MTVVSYRSPTLDDRNRILKDWMRSAQNETWRHELRPEVWFRGHKALIGALLRRGECVIACSPEAPSQILGWCAYERPDVVHYVYVAHLYRHFGIASGMIRHALGDMTGRDLYCTATGRTFDACERKYRLVYDPYRMLGRFNDESV